jgi:hypothetical protein
MSLPQKADSCVISHRAGETKNEQSGGGANLLGGQVISARARRDDLTYVVLCCGGGLGPCPEPSDMFIS